MKSNPLIPYILIMAFGIGLIFFMSVDGASNKDDHAEGDGDEAVAFDPESFAQQACIGCHGGDLTGGAAAPAIAGLTDAAAAKEIIKNGKNGMPGGLIKNDADIDAMVEYLMSLK